MASGITDMQPGDYVKTGPGRLEKIASVYGVRPDGTLAKPSEGGMGVITESGKNVSMFQALRYFKANEVEQ